jgi:ribonucleoside-diphosphate reductase alpha chain
MPRIILPNRRPHETFNFEHWGQTYVVGVGFVGDEPKEIFLDCSKTGWAAEVLARDSAVILSIALQHGVTIDELRHTISKNLDGTPSGPMGRLLELISGMQPLSPPPAEPEPAPVDPTPPSPTLEGAAHAEAGA